ncbi:MAG: hypothetical protein U0270_36190 [Labilithrix sp.]
MRVRLPALAALSCMTAVGLCVVVGACGDSDNPPQVRQPVDAAKVEPHLPDAGSPAPRDSAALDVNVEASFPEAWDRSKSARDAALEASSKYCSPAEEGIGQFCWDFSFDDGITGWNEVLEDGGKHELVGGNTGEPLRSLQSTVFADAGPGPHWVSLRYLVNIDDIPDAAAGITLSFSFRASSVTTPAVIGGLQIGTPKGPALRGLAVYPGGCTIVPGVPCLGENTYDGTDKDHRRPFDPKQWYRARIHLQPSGLGGSSVTWASTMTVGSAVIAQHDTEGLPSTSAFPKSVNLFVGAFDTTVAGQTVVEIDDILLE